MKTTTDELRELYRAAGRGVDAEAPGCPPADLLRRLAEGAVDAGERSSAVEHIARCSDCADAYRLALELVVTGVEQGATPRRDRRRWPSKPWLAVAATVVIVLAAVVLWRTGPLGPSGGPVVTRGAELPSAAIEPANGVVLPAAPAVLRWQPPAGASGGAWRFQITVLDARTDLLWRSDWLERSRVELPAAARDRVAAAGRVYWRVTARRPGELRQSELYRFEIRP